MYTKYTLLLWCMLEPDRRHLLQPVGGAPAPVGRSRSKRHVWYGCTWSAGKGKAAAPVDGYVHICRREKHSCTGSIPIMGRLAKHLGMIGPSQTCRRFQLPTISSSCKFREGWLSHHHYWCNWTRARQSSPPLQT